MSTRHYPLRIARTAHGIRAQDLRTLVRTAWWARRWMGVLEAMRLGARLGRGRQYAVQGQVVDLDLEGSHVEAKVQGSRPEPYRVMLDFTAISDGGQLARRLADEPMLLGRLLTDDLPTEIDDWFRQAGTPLFPRVEPIGKTPEGKNVFDVRMSCNCPDWARPCKHLVAVLLLLGEEIASRPATLLSLRGIDVEDCLPEEGNGSGVVGEVAPMTIPTVEGGDSAAWIRRLGAIPFWRGESRCVDALAKVYSRVHETAKTAADGKSIDLRV